MHMPTGSGKTRTAMNILADFLRNNEFKDKSILWIGDRNHLCEQAALEFEQAWSYLGNNSANVIRLYSEKSKNIEINQFNNGSSFVVSTIQFLLSLRNNQNYFFLNFIKKIGMIVFDETHLIIADQYKEIIEAMTPSLSTYLLGLTATPGRSYINMNEDRKLSDFSILTNDPLEWERVTLSKKLVPIIEPENSPTFSSQPVWVSLLLIHE